MNKRGFLEGSEMAHDVQHAARQRPDLVVRGEQLPARQRPVPVRPAVLEQRFARACRRACISFYLRNMYQENRWSSRAASRSPARRSTCGGSGCRPISSRRARTTSRRGAPPIAARSCCAGRTASCSPRRGTSPALSTRRTAASTATGSIATCRRNLRQWFAGATEIAGSWWPDWHRWVTALDKRQVKARVPGDGKLTPIEDAPGSYVKVQAS